MDVVVRERVYTIHDYFDGPLGGVADFDGRPHAYRSLADPDKDAWSAPYALKPLDAETFDAVMRDWAIWLRWEKAYHAGRTPLSTHPALPEDAEEHRALAPLVEAALDVPADAETRAYAEFEKDAASGELMVKWTIA